ncbi:MAG: glycoside-pentoside-hexuronide (GPH):cation symporter [Pseudomonadales bacterium]
MPDYGQRVRYGVGIGGLWLVFMTTAFYLLYYYTDVLGLSGRTAGTILLIATLWDAVTDPLMGLLISRTKSRWGAYRPYLIFGAAPMAASFILVFSGLEAGNGQIFLFALLSQILFRTLFTIVYIPYTALIARLSPDANERASIASVKAFFTSLGALTVSFYGLPLVARFGAGNDSTGFLLTASLFGAISVLTLMTTGLGVRETTTAARGQSATDVEMNNTGGDLSLAQSLHALISNRAFMLVFFGVILFTGCYTVFNKATVYFFQYDYGDRDAARYALAAVSIAGLISPFFWAWVTHYRGKRFVWISGCILAAVSLLLLYALNMPELPLPVITGCYFATGCGIQAFLMTFYTITADAIDYGEWQRGTRPEAIGFGLLSFANKASLAIGGFVLGWFLDEIGYVAGREQPAAVLEGIRGLLIFGPVAGFLASAAVISRFPVTNALHATLVSELRKKKLTSASL